MIKIIVNLFLVFNYLVCFGQVDSTNVPFVSYWSIGDTYDFKVTKIKQQWKYGQITKNDSSTYIAKFEVIDSTDTKYRIKWTYKTNLKDFNIPPQLEEKLTDFQLTEIIYQTTETGQYIEIENWGKIALMMKEIWAATLDYTSQNQDINKDEITNAIKPLMESLNSKKGIEQLLLRELLYIHFPFGLLYPVNKPILYNDELPNMFGGNPIKADGKLYFEKVDFEKSYCVMIQELNLNPNDTKKIMLAAFNKMGIDKKEIKKAMKTAKIDIKDYNRFEYYFYPGIPIKIETNRKTMLDFENEKGKRITKTIIELIN